MKDFRINPNETAREREIRICQSPAFVKRQIFPVTAVNCDNTIELFRNRNGWMAKHTDPDVRALFGTDTIPTAFTSQASATEVLAQIQKLNPNARVYLRAEKEN